MGLPQLWNPTRWQAARHAQVLPLDTALPGPDGCPVGVYSPVPIVHPPGWCDHLDTICAGCLPAWAEDHAVALLRHGVDGATAGCRCPICRHTIPASPARPAAGPAAGPPTAPSASVPAAGNAGCGGAADPTGAPLGGDG
jgi:hypothetical protein